MDCYSCFSPVKPKEEKSNFCSWFLWFYFTWKGIQENICQRKNRWITNYSCFAHFFFLEKKWGILCIFNSTSYTCIMHWTGKTLNRGNFKPHHTLPFYEIHASHVNFGLNQAFPVNPLPICHSYIRMNYSEHIPCHKING